MNITVTPGQLNGTVPVIPSKSQVHRLLICAAFSDKPTTLICPEINQDIEATALCLQALGADIVYEQDRYHIKPIATAKMHPVLDCQESGSTLRFLLPIAGALGVNATFIMSGRLPQRPLSPLWEEMERHGCSLSRPTETTIAVSGKLAPGEYTIDGSVSSQFITGLLFALAILPGENQLEITGNIESKPYITMTCKALEQFGVQFSNGKIVGAFPFCGPKEIYAEGDWSNGAFFLAANTMGSKISVHGLDEASFQGDRAVADILRTMDGPITVDVKDIPDLVPILAVVAGAKSGATFQNIQRLRLKESDRVASVVQMLTALGASAFATDDTLTVHPGKYKRCSVNSHKDHRIAMAAAIAATVAEGPVTIIDAQCVQKFYSFFWEVYRSLGGSYEQYIR